MSRNPYMSKPVRRVVTGHNAARRSIILQRGTNYGWANRSGDNSRIAFTLIDGRFTDGLG
jgi:hypothetical protein